MSKATTGEAEVLRLRQNVQTLLRRRAYCARSQPTRNARNSGILEAGMVVALGPTSDILTDVRSGP